MQSSQYINTPHQDIVNGIRIITQEQPGFPVALSIRVHMGSMYDPDTLPGLAHFCEHALLTGTQKFASKSDAARYVEGMGGRFWASTGYDDFGIFFLFGDRSDLPHILSLLEDFVVRPTLLTEHIESERGAVESEMRRKESHPAKMALSSLHEIMYVNDPLGHPILGTGPALAQFSVEDIKAFMAKYIVSGNVLLTITGDIERDVVLSSVREYFHLPLGDSRRILTTPELAQVTPKEIKLEYLSAPESYLAIGYHTVPLGHEDHIPLQVLAELLGGGRSSLLIARLRQELGLVYDINVEQHGGGRTGEFVIETSAKGEHLSKVREVIREEIQRIADNAIDITLIDFIKLKLIKSRILLMETSYSRMFEASEHYLLTEAYDPNHFAERVARITPDILSDVARKYLHTAREFVVRT